MRASGAKSRIVDKHIRLDGKKLKRVQKVLNAKTETEAIELALDMVLSEHEKNRIVEKSLQEFFASGVEIRDVYGALEPGVLSGAGSH